MVALHAFNHSSPDVFFGAQWCKDTKILCASSTVESRAGNDACIESTRGRIKPWIWEENGRNIVGWLGSNLIIEQSTGSRILVPGFSLLGSFGAGFTDTRFKHAVIYDGKTGVVISRSNVGYRWVRENIRVNVIMQSSFDDNGSGFCSGGY